MTADLPPDSVTLRRFLLGDLPPAELEAVGRFLEDHPQVASTLAGMKADDTLLSALRGPAEVSDTPDVHTAAARAAALVGGEPATRSPVPTPSNEATAAPDAPAADDTDDPFGALAPAEADGELGRLGGYRVLRLLGQGGMGAVFEAADDRLGRRVALKVMLPALAAKSSARQRFLREARAAAAVEHDYIVPIYQTGEDRGVPFLAMPLLAGETLDDRLKGGRPLAVADVLRIGREVADGLAAAHAAGLVHRDIKPSNVWLERTADGAFKRTRILDFGLARTVTGADGLTESGAILGTPAYMAPEQARGAALDHRADLFSLGCVLYQAATGHRPFAGAETFSVLIALATTEPPPASEVNPVVPTGLSSLITRLLAKDPTGRPASARAVADELARLAAEPARDSLTHIAGTGSALPPAAGRPGGDSTEAFEPAAPRRASRRRWRVAAAVLFLAVAGLAATNGPTIVRVVTNEGELVVEVDDPNTQVVVKGGAVELRREEGGKKRVYLVTATKDGEVKVREPGSDTWLEMEKFQLRRGGDVLVKVTAEKLAAARQPKTGPPAPGIPASAPTAVFRAPTLPAADSPPARDAFPGRLAFHDTFDDPKASTVFQGARDGARFAVENGVYTVAADMPPVYTHYQSRFGTAGPATAFATRVRCAGGTTVLGFRPKLTTDRMRWLSFVIYPDGSWVLHRANSDVVDGKWVSRNHEVLKASQAPDPDLANGRWVNVAGRAVGDEHEVWVNGRSVGRGVVADVGVPVTFALEIDVEAKGGAAVKLEVEYAAGWDLDPPLTLPAPKLPASDTPPATDAFPGRLVFHDTFDDPKTVTVFQGTRDGQRSAVDKGAYRVETAVGKAGVPITATFAPAAPDVAFVTRTKVENGYNQVVFRVRTTPTRGNWLIVHISPAGRWVVGRIDMTSPGGKRDDKWTHLAEATADDPALAAGKWVTVAGRAVGKDYEVWLNGKSVARGTDDPAFDGPNAFTAAVQATAVVAADGPAAVAVDYAAVWDLSPPPASPAGPTAEQRRALEWVLAVGGKLSVQAGGKDHRLKPGDALPPGFLSVQEVNLAGVKAVDDATVVNLRDIPAFTGGQLQLHFTNVGDAGLAKLATYPALTGVAGIALERTRVTDAGLAHLKAFDRLEGLYLPGLPITAAGLAHLKGSKLTGLTLMNCPELRDDALDAVADMPGLKVLDITQTRVTPVGLAKLAKLPHLQRLHGLYGDAVTDDFRALATLTKLRGVVLSSAVVTDAGLARLPDLPDLTELILRDCKGLTAAGLAHLGGCKALRELFVENSPVPKAALQKLAADRPELRVELDGRRIEAKALPDPMPPAGGQPPARDAVPGDLLFYDTFDDAKKSTLPFQAEGQVRTAVREGKYVTTIPAAKGVRRSFLDLPAAGADGAGGTVVGWWRP